MDLILWRHAEAEDGGPDLERRLTPAGREQAARVGKWLLEHLPPDFELIASPAARAQQTAGALNRKITTSGRIAPGATVAAILEAAGSLQAERAVIVVGHQPDLGRAAAHLVAGSGGSWSIRKGGLWWLTRRVRDDEPQVVVRAVLSPELLE